MEARRLGILPKLQIVSVDDKATKAWFLGPGVGGKVTPTWISGGMKHEEFPVVASEMQRLAGSLQPAGQVKSEARSGSGPQRSMTTPPPSYAMYVSAHCGACARALQLIASSPKLLQAIEIRQLEGNPRYKLDVHDLGARKTPVLVGFTSGKVSGVYEGPAAWAKLVEIG